MKRCPICKTTLFDDMDTCYGCMYKFGTKPELEARVSIESNKPGVENIEIGGLNSENADLFGSFLVECEGFLRKFIADRKICV